MPDLSDAALKEWAEQLVSILNKYGIRESENLHLILKKEKGHVNEWGYMLEDLTNFLRTLRDQAQAAQREKDTEKIERLKNKATELGMVIYSIHFRNAGVAIQWHDKYKQGDFEWQVGLHIEKYYPSFDEAIDSEMERLMRISAAIRRQQEGK